VAVTRLPSSNPESLIAMRLRFGPMCNAALLYQWIAAPQLKPRGYDLNILRKDIDKVTTYLVLTGHFLLAFPFIVLVP
jgi:hypothetical protein